MEQDTSLINGLHSLSDITPAVFKSIFRNYNERLRFPTSRYTTTRASAQQSKYTDLYQVESKEFDIWYEQLYEDENAPNAEYDFCSKKITIFAPPTPVDQHIVGIMAKWLQEVAYQLSDSKNDYSPCTLYEVILGHDDKEIPDVVLCK